MFSCMNGKIFYTLMERDEKLSMNRIPRFQTVGGRRMRHSKPSTVGRISCQALKTTAMSHVALER